MSEINSNQSWKNFSLKKVFRLILGFFGIRLLIGLTAAFAATLLFRWLAEEVFEGETAVFDETVRVSIHQIASPLLTRLMRLLSMLGSTVFLFGLGSAVAFVFWYLRHKRALALFLLTMAGEMILLFWLKTSFRRARPEPFFDFPLPSSYSFPSGHAFASFCFYGILAWLITARLQNRRLKITVWTTTVILVFLIGISRIYLGVHFPSDVVAGYAVGLIWVVTVALADFLLHRKSAAVGKS